MADDQAVDFEADEGSDVETGVAIDSTPADGGKVEETAESSGRGGVFESVSGDGRSGGPAKSVEGWILFVTGVHEEAQEDDVLDAFADFGSVKNINVNLDRRTGFAKGYALVEYELKKEAEAAIAGMDGKDILGETVCVDWAFVQPKGRGGRRGGRRR